MSFVSFLSSILITGCVSLLKNQISAWHGKLWETLFLIMRKSSSSAVHTFSSTSQPNLTNSSALSLISGISQLRRGIHILFCFRLTFLSLLCWSHCPLSWTHLRLTCLLFPSVRRSSCCHSAMTSFSNIAIFLFLSSSQAPAILSFSHQLSDLNSQNWIGLLLRQTSSLIRLFTVLEYLQFVRLAPYTPHYFRFKCITFYSPTNIWKTQIKWFAFY